MAQKKITAKVRDKAGLVHIERQIHDGAIVISGSLAVISEEADPAALIAEELETAARKITEYGGIVGHIKATVAVTSSSMISVTDEKAAVKGSPLRRLKITLAAIVFAIEPETAENIVRKALSDVRARLGNGDIQQ
jgi:SepF-like predicted cell division protein (DUF552 family)